MNIDHRRRAIEWWCHQHAENPTPLNQLAQQAAQSPPPEPSPQDIESRPLYDTGISTEDSLWTRTGWAGRS